MFVFYREKTFVFKQVFIQRSLNVRQTLKVKHFQRQMYAFVQRKIRQISF